MVFGKKLTFVSFINRLKLHFYTRFAEKTSKFTLKLDENWSLTDPYLPTRNCRKRA